MSTPPPTRQEVAGARELLQLHPGPLTEAEVSRALRRRIAEVYRGASGGIDDRARPYIEAEEILTRHLRSSPPSVPPQPQASQPRRYPTRGGRDRAPGARVVEVPGRAVRMPDGRIIITGVRAPGD